VSGSGGLGTIGINWFNDSPMSDVTIEYLYIKGGLVVTEQQGDSHPFTVRNCLFNATSDAEGAVIVFSLNAYNPGDNIQGIFNFYNNVVICGTNQTQGGMYLQAIDYSGDVSTIAEMPGSIQNNTFYGAGVGTGIYIELGATGGLVSVPLNIQNNAVFNFGVGYTLQLDSAGGTEDFSGGNVGYNASSDATANAFGGATGLNSQSGAAWFTSAPNNLTLLSTSPGKDAGTTPSSPPVTIDIRGTARPQNVLYDIGAFEFALASGTATIIRGPRVW
jgi:hypothetical protein